MDSTKNGVGKTLPPCACRAQMRSDVVLLLVQVRD